MVTKLPPKQEETVEVIYRLTHQHNYPPTLDEIAAEMGITKGTLQYHMTALRKKEAVIWNTGSARSVRVVDPEAIEHCRDKFPSLSNVGTYANFTSKSTAADYERYHESEFAVERKSIPILGKIAAGMPLHLTDKTDEYLELDSYFEDGCFALRVKGESMIEACISDGDLILVEPRKNAINGEIVVALIDNEAATLKRFFNEGKLIRLQPENESMEPIYIDPSKEDLKIQGVVKGVIRKL